MTETTKETAAVWFTEFIKSVGVPTAVLCAFMWVGKQQMDLASARFDKQQTFIVETLSLQLDKSTAVMGAINETLKRMADEQRETRAVLREVQAHANEQE
jgi:hypothetical protein